MKRDYITEDEVLKLLKHWDVLPAEVQEALAGTKVQLKDGTMCTAIGVSDTKQIQSPIFEIHRVIIPADKINIAKKIQEKVNEC